MGTVAVFPILADVVDVKTGSWSTAHWSNDFIRLNGWLRNCFAQLITPLEIDGIGQNWEDSNIAATICRPARWCPPRGNAGDILEPCLQWTCHERRSRAQRRLSPNVCFRNLKSLTRGSPGTAGRLLESWIGHI